MKYWWRMNTTETEREEKTEGVDVEQSSSDSEDQVEPGVRDVQPAASEGATHSQHHLAGQAVRANTWSFGGDPLFKRYRQLHVLGMGRYGEVYAGEDAVTGQEVALKMVDRRKMKKAEDAREEYRKISGLCHKHIIFGIAFFRSSPFRHLDTIVIQRVKGKQIMEYLIEGHHSEEELKKLFQELLQAVQYLILHKIIHGDIKPENILVAEEGVLKLVDFGSANPDVEFSAPEVHTSKATHASDIWSCGALLYSALSGVSPFLDDSPEETVSNKCNLNFSFPSEYFSTSPESSVSIIKKILVLTPEDRPHPDVLLEEQWFKEVGSGWILPSEKLKDFMYRRNKSVLYSE